MKNTEVAAKEVAQDPSPWYQDIRTDDLINSWREGKLAVSVLDGATQKWMLLRLQGGYNTETLICEIIGALLPEELQLFTAYLQAGFMYHIESVSMKNIRERARQNNEKRGLDFKVDQENIMKRGNVINITSAALRKTMLKVYP